MSLKLKFSYRLVLKNIALKKNVIIKDIDTSYLGEAKDLVDGLWQSNIHDHPANQNPGSCIQTKNEPSQIRVDLGKIYAIAALNLVGAMYNWYENKTQNLTILVGNTTNDNTGVICKDQVDASKGNLVPILCNSDLSGRYVTISSEKEMKKGSKCVNTESTQPTKDDEDTDPVYANVDI